jgi:aspartate racemase
MPTPLHIGIVACSAEGAALCYRTICTEGAALLGPHAHPEISMHTPSFAEYVRCLETHDVEGVGKLMAASAAKLARAGADFLICPDNTIHESFSVATANSALPWLHIAGVVAAEAQARGYARLGLTGTHWLVASDVYPEQLGRYRIECVRPQDRDRAEMGRIIMDELVSGIVKPDSVAYCLGVIAKFRDDGCDAAVLGCTELPLIIGDHNSPLPTLDSTRLLARAALVTATAGRLTPDSRRQLGI